MLYVFKSCIGVIAYTPSHCRCFFLRIWIDLGQNIFGKFMKFCQISEKYTFFHWHRGAENSFRPSLNLLLGFAYEIGIASMVHLDIRTSSLSPLRCLSYGLNVIWISMMSSTIYEKLKFIKFFMKKRYKQKELWFRI